MGKARDFLDIKFKDAQYREIAERVKDFNEVEILPTETEIREQSARCMDCGIPFCHGAGCPLANNIPEFNELVYRGHWKTALNILIETNDFPEFTGRVCPAPCETACTAGLHLNNVSIRLIELAIIEKAFKEHLIKPHKIEKRTNKSVAVIGSGPAGLSVANQLNKMGHNVTIYEKAQQAGGLLRYGIPDFKLDKQIVQRRIDLMLEEGVTFELATSIGGDITPHFLLKKYDAVCIACGSRNPRDLNIPGRDFKNIYFALDYLTQQNQLISGEIIENEIISAKGKKVVVIGGGDTGSDCVGTANRQGATSIRQIEVMPKPPEERSDKTPWPKWPYKLRTSSSHKEGCIRDWDIIVKSFSEIDGKVFQINATKATWDISSGGFPVNMREIPNSNFTIDADLVFLAMGFTGPSDINSFNQLNLQFDQRTNIKVDKNFNTANGKVFATGDAVSGASLVVRAINMGKETAKKIDEFLNKS